MGLGMGGTIPHYSYARMCYHKAESGCLVQRTFDFQDKKIELMDHRETMETYLESIHWYLSNKLCFELLILLYCFLSWLLFYIVQLRHSLPIKMESPAKE